MDEDIANRWREHATQPSPATLERLALALVRGGRSREVPPLFLEAGAPHPKALPGSRFLGSVPRGRLEAHALAAELGGHVFLDCDESLSRSKLIAISPEDGVFFRRERGEPYEETHHDPWQGMTGESWTRWYVRETLTVALVQPSREPVTVFFESGLGLESEDPCASFYPDVFQFFRAVVRSARCLLVDETGVVEDYTL